MTKRQVHTYSITRRDQIQAMASPVRLEILDGLRVNGPCSIAELARFLGRAADSLYYHFRKLKKVGLLLEAGFRDTGRREEAIYMTAGKRLRLPFDSNDSQLTDLRLKTFAALLRLTERDHRRAIRLGKPVFSGPKRNIRNGRIKGWLSAAELQEAHQYMDRLIDIFERDKPGPDHKDHDLFAITIYLTPIVKRTLRSGADRSS